MSENRQSAKEIHKKRSILWDQSMEYHRQYIDTDTGLFADKFVEYRSCPVCQKDDYFLMFEKAGGLYVSCNHCRMVYLNPVFKDPCLEEFYSNNHTAQSEVSDDDLAFYHRIFSAGLDLAAPFLNSHATLLDYGCSSGNFLDLAVKKGWRSTHGVELNKKEAAIAGKKGHTIYPSSDALVNSGQYFDLICLWDVFEHLKDGTAAFTQFSALLNPGGLIFLQIPNAEALAAKVMHEKCNMFDGLEHVNLYGPSTISQLAEQCSLDIVAMETVIPELNVLQNYLSYEDPYNGSQPSVEAVLPGVDEDYLKDHLLGYKLQIVLRAKP